MRVQASMKLYHVPIEDQEQIRHTQDSKKSIAEEKKRGEELNNKKKGKKDKKHKERKGVY